MTQRLSRPEDAPPLSRPAPVSRVSRLTLFVGDVHNRGSGFRFLKRLGGGLLAGVTFALALVGGALLHLDTDVVRRVAQRSVNAGLATVFKGRIEVGPITHVHLEGADIESARIIDPQNNVIIEARGIHGEFATWKLLETLIAGDVPLAVTIPRARIEDAIVHLVDDGTGVPTIASTFVPRDTSPSDPDAQPVRVSLPAIEIGRAVADGEVGVPIDATVHRVSARIFVRETGVTLDVGDTALDLRSIVPGGVRGTADYHLRFRFDEDVRRPTETDPVLRMWADLVGEAANVGTLAHWEMLDDRMKGRVDVPKVVPASLHAVLPDVPLTSPARVTAIMDGPLERVAIDGRVEVEPSAGNTAPPAVLMIEGDASVTNGVRLEARFYGRDLDLKTVREELPATRIDTRGVARVTLGEDGAVRIGLDVATDETAILGQVVPAIDAHVDVGEEVVIAAHAHEDGAPVDALLRVLPGGALLYGIEAHSDSLRTVKRLGGVADGNVHLEVRGGMADGKVSARYEASGRGIVAGSARIDAATVRGTLHGPPPDFEIDTDASLSGLSVDAEGGERTALKSAVVHATGPLLSPFLSAKVEDAAGGTAHAEARLDVRARSASGVTFGVERDGERAQGKVERLAIEDGGVVIRGVAIEGAGVGSIKGSVAIERGELVGKLKGESVDLARATKLFGLRVPVAGMANIDVDVERTKSGRKGHVDVEIARGRVLVVDGLSARLSAVFEDDHVEASGYLRLVDEASPEERAAASEGRLDAVPLCDGTIAEVRLGNVNATTEGALLKASTWSNAVGTAEISAEHWSLYCVARRVPFVLPLSEIRGTLSTRVQLHRDPGDRLPTIDNLYVRTHDLELVGARPAIGEPAWATRSIDVEVEGSFDGRSSDAPFTVKLFDDTYLATASGHVDLDGVIHGSAPPIDALFAAPFEVDVRVPRRGFGELGTLPSPAREAIPPIGGDFRIEANARGTLASPSLTTRLQVFGVGASGALADWSPPVDADARLTYDASTGGAVVSARAMLEGATVGEVVAGLEVPYAALRAGGDSPVPWRGGATATLYELPLAAFPLLADRGMKGSVSGHASVSGLNESPRAEVDLQIPLVTLGDTSFGGRIRAEISPASTEEGETDPGPEDAGAVDAGAIDAAREEHAEDTTASGDPIGVATLEVDLEDGKHGSISLLAHARVGWRDRVVPVLDGERRGGVGMSAEGFQIAAVQPLVSGAVSKLTGLLDGQAVFEWGEDAGTGRIASASLRVRDGVVYVPELGQELHGVTAKLDAEGPGELVLRDVVAEGVAGRATAAARVHLVGTRLEEAALVLKIAKDEEMPLTFAGIPTGRVRTDIEVQLHDDHEAKRLDAYIDVNSLHFEMPSFSSRSVQSLEDHDDVVIDVPLGPPEETRRVNDGSTIVLHIALKNVTVKAAELATIEAATPETLQGGRPAEPLVVRLADTVETSGDIAVTSGTFDFLGKEFELDSGLVRLRQEDPGNPFVNVTAHWDGPDGGRIIIDYVGVLQPITDDKIKFRSDPARSEREILASLLFGESLSDIPPGGSSGAGGAGQGNVAGSVGGSVASSGLNEILRNTALRRFSANIGTTDSGNLRTGVEFRASDQLRLGLAQENDQAQATGGEGQATTASTAATDKTRTELSVDWRFHRTWSLRGTFGKAGAEPLTGVDLVWQYRY